jgi:Secretion system C-terminal sorting domain
MPSMTLFKFKKMKRMIFFGIFMFLLVQTQLAQKEDNVWLLGGCNNTMDSVLKSCSLSFTDEIIDISFINKNMPATRCNSMLCDSIGKLICFTNGKNVYNENWEIMLNGDNFYPDGDYSCGFPAVQTFMILPFPSNNNKFIYIYGKPTLFQTQNTGGYSKFYYAVGDMTLNNGLGKITSRENVFSTDSIYVGQITAVRHANGRDWWIFAQHAWKDDMFIYLLNENGIELNGTYIFNGAKGDGALAQTVFSPDGKWFARYRAHGPVPAEYKTTLDLFNFDRCSGLLSNRQVKSYHVPGYPGGVAFSESTNLMYVARWDTMYQYDMTASEIFGSETVVAAYDGFKADFNLPTRFFHMRLAPDHKIYCAVSNYNSRYLHVIDQPDVMGVACNVRQHGVHLPVFNDWIIPNIPYYRLYIEVGSDCDTLLTSTEEVLLEEKTKNISIYPNPANDYFDLLIQHPNNTSTTGTWSAYTINGQAIATGALSGSETKISTQTWADGVYVLYITLDGVRSVAKVVVSRW